MMYKKTYYIGQIFFPWFDFISILKKIEESHTISAVEKSNPQSYEHGTITLCILSY